MNANDLKTILEKYKMDWRRRKMAVRPIDAVHVLNDINWHHKPTPVSEFESGFNQGLNQAMWIITHAPTLTPQNEWVSVDERLPDNKGEYLVAYHPCIWDFVSDEICVGFDSFRGKTTWAKKKYQRVTHWMPLPAPPKSRPPEGEET